MHRSSIVRRLAYFVVAAALAAPILTAPGSSPVSAAPAAPVIDLETLDGLEA